MLIRSQGRKCIVVLNSITALAIRKSKSSGKFDIAAITPPGGVSYGGYVATTIDTYSTEAKAIKVMDMIQKAYTIQKSKLLWCEILRSGILSDVSAESLIDTWNAYTSSIAFDMPADEDVEA